MRAWYSPEYYQLWGGFFESSGNFLDRVLQALYSDLGISTVAFGYFYCTPQAYCDSRHAQYLLARVSESSSSRASKIYLTTTSERRAEATAQDQEAVGGVSWIRLSTRSHPRQISRKLPSAVSVEDTLICQPWVFNKNAHTVGV